MSGASSVSSKPMHMSNQKTKNRWVRAVLLTLFIILAILFLLPIVTIVVASLRPGADLIRYGLNLQIDPAVASMKNYQALFSGQNDYFVWLKNSLVITVIQIVLTLLISAFVSYGLAAYDFKGKTLVFLCVLLILMVPFEILMLPLYEQTISMNMIDSVPGVILPFLANATTIFFFKQYVEGIPHELIDSGRVDGCTEYGIFFKLIFPIMKPAIASMAILCCMNSWNNFLWPLLVFKSQSKFTLPIGLATLMTPYGNNYDLLIAGSVFSIIPIFVLFLFFQRYFIEGMTAGSVKG